MEWNRIDFPSFHENVFCDLVFVRVSLAGLCPNDIFEPSGQAGEPKDVQCWATGAQLSEGQLCFARWHSQCNKLLSSTNLASGSSVQLTWLAQTLRRHTQSRFELLKWKTGDEPLRLADVMTGKAHHFCQPLSYTDGLRVLSMKADHRRLLQEAEIVSPFYCGTIACHSWPAMQWHTYNQLFCFSLREPDSALSPLVIHFECAQISIFCYISVIVDLPKAKTWKCLRGKHLTSDTLKSATTPSPNLRSSRSPIETFCSWPSFGDVASAATYDIGARKAVVSSLKLTKLRRCCDCRWSRYWRASNAIEIFFEVDQLWRCCDCR